MRNHIFFITLILLTSFSSELLGSNNFNIRLNYSDYTFNDTYSAINGINLNFNNQNNIQLMSKFELKNEDYTKSKFNEPFMTLNMKPIAYNFSTNAVPPSSLRADPVTRTFVGACVGLVAAAMIGGKDVSKGALIAGTAIGGVLGFVVWQVTLDDLQKAF